VQIGERIRPKWQIFEAQGEAKANARWQVQWKTREKEMQTRIEELEAQLAKANGSGGTEGSPAKAAAVGSPPAGTG